MVRVFGDHVLEDVPERYLLGWMHSKRGERAYWREKIEDHNVLSAAQCYLEEQVAWAIRENEEPCLRALFKLSVEGHRVAEEVCILTAAVAPEMELEETRASLRERLPDMYESLFVGPRYEDSDVEDGQPERDRQFREKKIVKNRLSGGGKTPEGDDRVVPVFERWYTARMIKKAKHPIGAVWQTPGDGLCLIHSLFCNVPHSNYAFLVANAMADAEKMKALVESYLKPTMKKFLAAEGKNLEPDDREKLEAFVEKGSFPDDLSVDVIAPFANFAGIVKPIAICMDEPQRNEKLDGHQARMAKRGGLKFWSQEDYLAQQSTGKLKDWITIFWSKNHFRHMTPTNKYANTPLQTFVKDGWKGLSELNAELDYQLLDAAFSSMQEVQKREEGLIAKVTKLRQQIAEVKKESEIEVASAIEQENKKQKTETDKILTFIDAATKAPPAEKIKYFPTSLKQVNGSWEGFYSTRFAYGKEAKPYFDLKKIRYNAKAQTYEHPWLRTLADWSNFESIKTGLKCGYPVLEHAAKYAKTLKWFEQTPTRNQYDFTRPDILPGVDDIYRMSNPIRDREGLLDLTAERVFTEIRDAAERWHVFTDVCYYRSVMAALLRAPNGTRGSFSVGNYPAVEGVYEYFDNEGKFTITGSTIHNEPNGNGKGYKHDLVCFPLRSFSMVAGEQYLKCSLHTSDPTGIHSHYSLYLFQISNCQEFELLEWEELYPTAKTCRVQRLKDESELRFNRSTGGYDRVSKVDVIEEVVQVNHNLLSWLESGKASFKADNRTSMMDQHKFLKAEYATERRLKILPPMRSTDFSATFDYWAQKASLEYKRTYAGLRAPIMHDLRFEDSQTSAGGLRARCNRWLNDWSAWWNNDPNVRRTQGTFVSIENKPVLESNQGIPTREERRKFLVTEPSAAFSTSEDWREKPQRSWFDKIWRVWECRDMTEDPDELLNSKPAITKTWNEPREESLTTRGAELKEALVEKGNDEQLPALKGGRTAPALERRKIARREKKIEAEASKETITSRHFVQRDSKRFYHFAGNESLNVKKIGRREVCKCDKPKYEKILQTIDPVHFGSCECNLSASIYARAVNTDISPDYTTAYLFKRWVEEVYWPRNENKFFDAIDNLTSDDYDWETFLKETVPSKRRAYKEGMDWFLREGRIDTRFELFSKSNEVHYSPLWDVRPRLICNPSPSMKAAGAYTARLMIKIMKKIEPGFMSGYSTEELSRLLTEHQLRTQGDDAWWQWYSYDGSSHDAHQHAVLISAVDHFLIRKLITRLLSRTGSMIPEWLIPEMTRALCILDYSFYTQTGMTGKLLGTVFSGHPTLTTLFNTMRTILYNRFMVWCASPRNEEASFFMASGDDVATHLRYPMDLEEAKKILGSDFGSHGLGQFPKDFIVGPLEKHSFLSKRIITEAGKYHMIPMDERLYKAGLLRDLKSNQTAADQKAAMYIAHSDLPAGLQPYYRDRFYPGSNRLLNLEWALENAMEDWGFRLKLVNGKFDEGATWIAEFSSDKKWLLQTALDASDNAASRPVQIMNAREKEAESAVELVDRWIKKQDQASRKKKNELKQKLGVIGSTNKVKVVTTFSSPDVYRLKGGAGDGAPEGQKKKNRKSARIRPGIQYDVPRNLRAATVPLGPTIKALEKSRKFDKALEKAIARHEEYGTDELQYMLCLTRPDLYTAKIPSLYPVPSFVTHCKALTYVTATSSGNVALVLMPHNDTAPLYYTPAAGTTQPTETGGFGAFTWSVSSSSPTAAYAARRRVVGAYLKVTSMSPAMTRQGVLTAVYMPYNVTNNSNVTCDALRDQPGSLTVNAAINPSIKVTYTPVDPSSFTFTGQSVDPANNTQASTSQTTPCLVIAGMGLAAGSQLSVQYRVVYEIIPTPSMTDLLMPTIASSKSDPDRAVKEVQKNGFQNASIKDHSVESLIKAMEELARAGKIGWGAQKANLG